MKVGKFLIKKSFSDLADREGKIDILICEEAEKEEGLKIGEKYYSVRAVLDENREFIQGDPENLPQDILNNLQKWGF